jgi:hypothetical protein
MIVKKHFKRDLKKFQKIKLSVKLNKTISLPVFILSDYLQYNQFTDWVMVYGV